MTHLSSIVMKMKVLVFAFAVVAFFAAVSSTQDFDAAPAPAPAQDKGAAHSVVASRAMILCLPFFMSMVALLNN
ncbi:hypothetical protein PRUPE_2G011300 [Prunus persica]|uniref:Uncharacterized protein n=1 Tax=Prunus persica TaxID=3760 RepID=A0A251Q956_PRUPE|nr:hypothetical protein PRUPE_2G011300 [Prunus persica]